MCSLTDICFMCTNNYNCSFVNDRIVTQVEYLLPEITVIKLGVPLRICDTCEMKLHWFNEFKHSSLQNSQRLEARIKKAQCTKNNSAQVCGVPETQRNTGSCDMRNESTTVGTNSIVDISIKEEPCEETSDEREYYDNIVQNVMKTEFVIVNGVTCIKNNQIGTEHGTEEKSVVECITKTECLTDNEDNQIGTKCSTEDIAGASDQNFEEIYVKNEIIDESSMDYEDCDDLAVNQTENKTKEKCITVIDIDSNEKDRIASKSRTSRSTMEEVYDDVSEDILMRAKKATEDLLPTKSRAVYDKEFKIFINWKLKNAVTFVNETVMMAYFQELSEKYTPNSLYTKYSLLKSTLLANDNIDISRYNRLLSFLKKRSKGYTPKKSKVLTEEQVLTFIKNAPNEVYLLHKVVLVMSVFGGLRRDDMVKMTIDDVQDNGSVLVVSVPDTNTGTTKSFNIIEEKAIGALELVRQYIALRPLGISCLRFFLTYRNSQCTVQPVGKNTIGSVPTIVAKYLKLENVKEYNGHSLRHLKLLGF